MMDVDREIERATATAKADARRRGCTCDVEIRVAVCDGDEHHRPHVFPVVCVHASSCWLILRMWRAWN